MEDGAAGPKLDFRLLGIECTRKSQDSPQRRRERRVNAGELAGAVGLEPTPSSLTVRCPTNWTTPQLCRELFHLNLHETCAGVNARGKNSCRHRRGEDEV